MGPTCCRPATTIPQSGLTDVTPPIDAPTEEPKMNRRASDPMYPDGAAVEDVPEALVQDPDEYCEWLRSALDDEHERYVTVIAERDTLRHLLDHAADQDAG